jgi:hypothetical protein
MVAVAGLELDERRPPHLGLRTRGRARRNGSAHIPGPRHKSFQEVITVLDNWDASFEGLEENPESRAYSSNRPCDEE